MTQDSAVAEKVTQEMRVAAARLFDTVSEFHHPSGAAQHILDGKGDGSPFVQAILAAHTAGRLEGMREAIRTAEACDIRVPLAPGCPDGATIASQTIFTAIRALQEKHNG